MKIGFVSAEVEPFAKVGGLADVIGSLPKALAALGHDARIFMPAYRMVLDDPRWQIQLVSRKLAVKVGPNWTKPLSIFETKIDGVPVYLLGTDEWFCDATRSEEVYLPGAEQYLFFATAVLRAIDHLDWSPDVIHAHDWHTGFTPVIMREKEQRRWQSTAAVFTIHNLAYQGEFDSDLLERVDLPSSLFNHHQLEAWGRVNFLKSGCVYADQVNTVSPTYAKEILTPEYGCRLDGLMRHLTDEGRLTGILNGIDTEVLNPATDTRIAARYSSDDPTGKEICREALLRDLSMEPIAGAPVMGVVSRLSSQKGMDLMIASAEEMLGLPSQLIVLGTGDPWLADRFRDLQARFGDRVRFLERFDAMLAERIYAGADLFLMPSAFEPCGLGQMMALRYGTIPVVRQTGGLADTVFEGMNGFVFQDKTPEAFLAAVRRAAAAFGSATVWPQLIKTALSGDYSWDRSARSYEELYRRAVAARSPASVRSAS